MSKSSKEAFESWRALRQWIEENGGYVHQSLHMSFSTKTSMRGLSGKFAVNDELMRVPRKCLLDGSCSPWASWLEQKKLTLCHSKSDVSLALTLLEARAAGEASFYWPYIRMLPSETEFAEVLPHWWPAGVREQRLRGSPIVALADEEANNTRKDWNTLATAGICAALEEAVVQHVKIGNDGNDASRVDVEQVSLSHLMWAFSIILSRAFIVDGLSSGSQREDGLLRRDMPCEIECLVPAMDMMNHRRPRTATYAFDAKGSSMVVKDAQSMTPCFPYHKTGIPPDDGTEGLVVAPSGDSERSSTKRQKSGREETVDGEVFITYGAKSNGCLLLCYGFTVGTCDQETIDLQNSCSWSNTEPDGSCNDTRAVAFTLQRPHETVIETSVGTSELASSSQSNSVKATGRAELALYEERRRHWEGCNSEIKGQVSGYGRSHVLQGRADTRVVELRLASATAPKHYIFTPFSKALDACRVLTMKLDHEATVEVNQNRGTDTGNDCPDFDALEAFIAMGSTESSEYDWKDGVQVHDGYSEEEDCENEDMPDDEDENDSFGRLHDEMFVTTECAALAHLESKLSFEIAGYEDENTTQNEIHIDSKRVIEAELRTLLFFADIAKTAKAVLDMVATAARKNPADGTARSALISSVKELLMKYDATASLMKSSQSGNPLFPLCPVSDIVQAYLKIRCEVNTDVLFRADHMQASTANADEGPFESSSAP